MNPIGTSNMNLYFQIQTRVANDHTKSWTTNPPHQKPTLTRPLNLDKSQKNNKQAGAELCYPAAKHILQIFKSAFIEVVFQFKICSHTTHPPGRIVTAWKRDEERKYEKYLPELLRGSHALRSDQLTPCSTLYAEFFICLSNKTNINNAFL
jgi:hypothetical protein